MRMDRECDGNENYCAVYVCLNVLVVFPKKMRNRRIKEGGYQFIEVGWGW